MFYLHYVEDCTPKLKVFGSRKDVDTFMRKFDLSEDNVLDFVIEGKVVEVLHQHYATQLVESRVSKKSRK